MAVAFDAFSRPGTGTGVTGDQSWTHTPTGTPAGAYVWVLWGASIATTDDHVVGVTYGGVSMTEVTGSPIIKTTAETMQVHCFALESSVSSGAQTVAVDVDGETTAFSCGCITVTTSANAPEQIDVDATINSASLADPSVTLSLGGRTCFCAIGFVSGQNAATGITPLSGWTSQSEEDTGGQTMGFYTYDTVSTADVTAGWTQTAEDAVAIALAISEVVGGGGGGAAGPLIGGKLVGRGVLLGRLAA